MSRVSLSIGSLFAIATLAACTDTTAPVPATEAASLATLPATCASITMPVTSVVVVNRVMPAMRYTVTNCGSRKLTVVATQYEVFGALSGICPAPVATPARLTISAGKRVSASFPLYRGACGFASPLSQDAIVQGTASWQSHRLMISVRNATNNALLSTTASPYSWQDAAP